MAFSVVQNVEAPKFTVLSKYEVYRIGQYPRAVATFTECVYEMDGPGVVLSHVDGEIIVPSFAGMTNLVGRKLCLQDSTEIGRIATADNVWDDGVGAYVMVLTLDAPAPQNLATSRVGVVKTMSVGTPVYRKAVGGKEWAIVLDGSVGVAMSRMIDLLGAIYFAAVKVVLPVLGVSKTDAEIVAALNTLAAQQTNIDGLFAAQGETLEQARRSGTLHPSIQVTGDAPVIAS